MPRKEVAMIRILGVALVAALCVESASAQAVKQGNLSGTIVSASAVALTGGSDAVLLTTPASGAYVLTQVCIQSTPGANNNEQAQILGSTVGRIALILPEVGTDGGACTTFSPGFFLPAGEELRCAQGGVSASAITCSVTGVLSKK
jgi:hypothetical protein